MPGAQPFDNVNERSVLQPGSLHVVLRAGERNFETNFRAGDYRIVNGPSNFIEWLGVKCGAAQKQRSEKAETSHVGASLIAPGLRDRKAAQAFVMESSPDRRTRRGRHVSPIVSALFLMRIEKKIDCKKQRFGVTRKEETEEKNRH